MKNMWLLLFVLILSLQKGWTQHLEPGFDKNEYLDLLKITAQVGDSSYIATIKVPEAYDLAYRSPVFGLDNRWDLYIKGSDLAIISLRGTTQKSESWLANFYAAMVPAKGELKLSEEDTFSYNLATNPKAAVHVGWLISTAFLSNDILPKIDSIYCNGIKNIIITGHSQGGAIAYLLTAHFYSLQQQNLLPSDIRFKTYCSAGPKPGNLYFAYDYETKTQNGWAYNVVNSADWVPEVPISIQTVEDFNQVNPFTNARSTIKKQKFLTRLVMNHAFNKLYKPTKRAQKNYQKILGETTSKSVKKFVPGFQPPEYYESNHYVRTGTTIVLEADEAYYKLYPNDDQKPFIHHLHPPYIYLAEKLNFRSSFQEAPTSSGLLEGVWELTFITGRRIAFEGLFPNKKPTITVNLANNKIGGNTSCNNFSGTFKIEGSEIRFPQPFTMTKMFCPGEGEQVFLDTMEKVTSFQVDGNTLTFKAGDIEAMRFVKNN